MPPDDGGKGRGGGGGGGSDSEEKEGPNKSQLTQAEKYLIKG